MAFVVGPTEAKEEKAEQERIRIAEAFLAANPDAHGMHTCFQAERVN